MLLFYSMKAFYLAILFICVFGVYHVRDNHKDPYKVVAVCACLAVMAGTALVLWLAVANALSIDMG